MNELLCTSALVPHPSNPRVDLGELDELIESIKERGVLQNLTVVRGDDEKYHVIIGHRRLAAAKEIGIEYLPCMVVTMDEQTQIATMLLENMQRKDLTPYEQAKGVQQCLDLGLSVDDISKKTGLKKKQIKHRIKMLELDENKLQASQGTIDDYIALEEIEDVDKRNETLEHIGTNNFNMRVQSALRDEQDEKDVIEMKQLLTEKGITITNEFPSYDKYMYCRYIMDLKELSSYKFKEEYEYLFVSKMTTPSGQIYRLKTDDENKTKEKVASPEEIEKIEKKSRRKQLEEDCRSLRIDFMKELNLNHIIFKTKSDLIFKQILTYLQDNGSVEFCDKELKEYFELNEELFNEQVDKYPLKMLALNFYFSMDDDYLSTFDYFGKVNHRGLNQMKIVYEFLDIFGYEKSDEEVSLLDGQHELYEKEEVSNAKK